jgi:hypothetical protein
VKHAQNKARTLDWLSTRLKLFKVPELMHFSVGDWSRNQDSIVKNAMERFSGRTLVVRSSASDEDGSQFSAAGAYASVLSVPSTDRDSMCRAVATVVASYHRAGPRPGNDDIILQEMVNSTIMSGVVFTHDLNTGAPYYVINYDDVSGLTNTVTSGDGEYSNRTLYIHRGATDTVRSARFQKLLLALQELEEVAGSRFLDVEFVLSRNLTPYLLQARSITNQPNWNRAISRRIDTALQGIQSFVRTRFGPMDGVFGKTTVLGQMPDWNPAEMLGRAPRALAFSLYRTLITDHAWRIARERMGYVVPAGRPLMVSLAGQPFVDTRLSFNSFLPRGLASATCEKLVDTWIAKLGATPELHDKVEFDVAITTYSFDIDDKMESLIGDALGMPEKSVYKEALRKLTTGFLKDGSEGSVGEALARIEQLAERQAGSRTEPGRSGLDVLPRMIDECIRFGTVPFAILARHGFVARTLLLSLQRRGILTMEEVGRIQAGVRTVASELVGDMRRLQLGELSRARFMERYGHLRAGTYDILSLRYDQIGDLVLDGVLRDAVDAPEFKFTTAQRKEIERLLVADGFPWRDADGFLKYVREATAGREYAKFVFTRSVSEMLELIAAYGERHGLSRDELSHVPLAALLDEATTSGEGSVEDRIRGIAEKEAEHHALSAAIRLPQVLFDEAGVHVIPFQVSHPNFITHKSVSAACVQLYTGGTLPDLAGKIVLIENADPGFDWIFAHPIKGLITKYGGANSHMAIRCAEFGIPAAIGCGEQRFEVLVKADHIRLDCSASVIQVL